MCVFSDYFLSLISQVKFNKIMRFSIASVRLKYIRGDYGWFVKYV
jgi:hypothetical protein